MFEIIFDSNELEEQCVVKSQNLNINVFSPTNNIPLVFENRNIINLKYEKNLMSNESNSINDNIYEAQFKFISRLLNNDKFKNEFCWINCYGGQKISYDHIKQKISYDPIKQKINMKKSDDRLQFSFNDKLKINYNEKDIGITEFKKLCEHNISKFNLKFLFYAIIRTTKDNININIRMKLKEIKVLELKDQTLSLFNVSMQNNNRQYEYLQRYPTGKKKTVNNIMHLFNEVAN